MAASARAPSDLALGIDIGGTGVKGALVELSTGRLKSKRARIPTPIPSTPQSVAATVGEVIERIETTTDVPGALPAGCGLPGVARDGRLLSAANIDQGWLTVSAEQVIGDVIGRRVHVINDADAAGIAEMRLGVGRGRTGTVLLLTIGTGIGSALFTDGVLVRNTELGHFPFRGTVAEKLISGVARERRRLAWAAWADEFNAYLALLELLLNPDLLILGGGVSKGMATYQQLLVSNAPIVPAHFLNTAGIVGAALHAAELESA
ncbi:MAG: ROK family protein [Chloroflexota bacterium]|nr:ROK family protein [Chloroflexota bacterium]